MEITMKFQKINTAINMLLKRTVSHNIMASALQLKVLFIFELNAEIKNIGCGKKYADTVQ